MRVLAIVGTKGAFPRLIEALAEVARATGWDVRVQYATGRLPMGVTGWPTLSREAVLAEMEAADAVVCHAGSGTLRDALALGHRPIVVPRRARHGEHVNDHQLELAAALGARVVLLDDPVAGLAGEALAAALREAIAGVTRAPPPTLPGDTLRAALRAEVAAIAAAPPSLRARVVYRLLRAIAR